MIYVQVRENVVPEPAQAVPLRNLRGEEPRQRQTGRQLSNAPSAVTLYSKRHQAITVLRMSAHCQEPDHSDVEFYKVSVQSREQVERERTKWMEELVPAMAQSLEHSRFKAHILKSPVCSVGLA